MILYKLLFTKEIPKPIPFSLFTIFVFKFYKVDLKVFI